MSSIHAHAVLNMMIDQYYTEEKLLQDINEQFGSDAVFHTCSKEGMDAKTLLDFFKQKQKFTYDSEGNFTVNQGRVCGHGHEHSHEHTHEH